MMTIVTHLKLKPGEESDWDAAFRERIAAVGDQPGWIGVQLCTPVSATNERVVIGTWESQADWEAWHAEAPFAKTRSEMEGTESGDRQEWWHEVVLEMRKNESSQRPD